MTGPRPAIEHVTKLACPGCSRLVMHVEEIDTGEPIVVDPDVVDGGRIVVWSIKGHAFARRYGQPARIQPAWDEHQCPTPTVLTPPAATRSEMDPYEDVPPAVQQHGGWRQ